MSESNTKVRPAPEILLQMITGNWISQSIYVVAKLGIPDLLQAGPQSCVELARSVDVDSRSLYRVMRALASFGIFTEVGEGRFESTPLAQYLQTNVPNSLRGTAILFGEETYRAWGELLHTVKTGETAFEHVYGMERFQYLQQHPDVAEVFNKGMTGLAAKAHAATVAAYDFSQFKKVVDIGGGHGSLLSLILKEHSHVGGVLFDTQQVVEGAKKNIAASLSGRYEAVSGDFFESVPVGGDAYILSMVLHDWDDERSILILKNIHRAMVENGKLLVAEMVIPQGNEPFFGKLLDLNMLVMTGGWERTKAEYETLFEGAGFRLSKVYPTGSPWSVIEGVRIDP